MNPQDEHLPSNSLFPRPFDKEEAVGWDKRSAGPPSLGYLGLAMVGREPRCASLSHPTAIRPTGG